MLLIYLCVVCYVGGIVCVVIDDGKLLFLECLDLCILFYIDVILDEDDVIMLLLEGGFGWYLIQDLIVLFSYFCEGCRNFLVFIVLVEVLFEGDLDWIDDVVMLIVGYV